MATPADGSLSLLSSTISAFSRLVLSAEETAARRVVNEQKALGLDNSAICLDLLAPTARLLGKMWEDDTATFIEVTVAVGMLNRLLHKCIGEPDDLHEVDPLRRFLLVIPPDEQHTFGASMVATFLRRARWEVIIARPNTRADLCRLVHNEWFTIVGFSISRREQLQPLVGTIRAVRRASLNKLLRVMVGGAGFQDQPEMIAKVGADTTAVDANQVVKRAEHLLALLPDVAVRSSDRPG